MADIRDDLEEAVAPSPERMEALRAALLDGTAEDRHRFTTGEVLLAASRSINESALMMDEIVAETRDFREVLEGGLARIERQNDSNDRALKALVDG